MVAMYAVEGADLLDLWGQNRICNLAQSTAVSLVEIASTYAEACGHFSEVARSLLTPACRSFCYCLDTSSPFDSTECSSIFSIWLCLSSSGAVAGLGSGFLQFVCHLYLQGGFKPDPPRHLDPCWTWKVSFMLLQAMKQLRSGRPGF